MQKRLILLKTYYERYERYAMAGALLFGFVFDNLTLTRIDLWLDNLILGSYLTIVGGCAVLLNLHDAGRIRIRSAHTLDWILPLTMQFAVGNLFSGYIVFYLRSGSLAKSWPFLLFLAFFFLGNELFRSRYQRMAFRMGIFYIALFSFSIFSVPVLFNAIGVGIFILSGVASLVVFVGIAYLQSRVAPAYTRGARPILVQTIGAIYLIFNFFYFTNIIPPIPLSLKELGVYHSVERGTEGGLYRVSYEPKRWYEYLPLVRETYEQLPGQPVYAYSAVFAPTDIRTPILHRWSYRDERTGRWASAGAVRFQIAGGRDGGFRGYSTKSGVTPGLWRVEVVTSRGQLLGRKTFHVVAGKALPELETVER
jgi:hypothetical protein